MSWKRRLQILTALVMVPATVAFALFSLEKNGYFNVDSIDIVVMNFTEQTHYLQPLVKALDENLESRRGSSLWRIDIKDLQSHIQSLPWVEEASLMRKWPSKLKVEIRVKEVYFLLLTRSGQFRPVVKTGELLPSVTVKDGPDVAVLEGDLFEQKAELRKQAIGVIQEIPGRGVFSRKSISEMHFDDKEGFWMTLVQDGICVKMGQGQIATKSARVSQVLDYMKSRQMDARVIDANLSKKVLVRLRKDP